MTNKKRHAMIIKMKVFASAKEIAGGKDEVTLEFLKDNNNCTDYAGAFR